jgi:sugar/nucleoside kinase (ribokinase family)
MKKYDIYGIGSALMDSLIHVDDRDLEDLKLKKGTMHLVDEAHIGFISTVMRKRKQSKQAGGSVSNTIAGASNLGAKTFFNARVGKDKLGKDYEIITKSQGIKCDLRKDDTSTGHLISLITKDGERTFTTYLGSAVNFNKNDINKKALKQSKIIHMEGYMLEHETQKKALLKAMKIAKKNKIIISIDLSDPSLIKRNLEEFRKIVKKYVDILFLNEKEAEVFTGQNDPKRALLVASTYVKLAIVKIGSEGSMMKIKNKLLIFKAFKPNKVIDTTGAGDMFAAGVLYSISKNLSLEQAGKIASFAATKVIEQTGARIEYDLQKYLKNLY